MIIIFLREWDEPTLIPLLSDGFEYPMYDVRYTTLNVVRSFVVRHYSRKFYGKNSNSHNQRCMDKICNNTTTMTTTTISEYLECDAERNK